MLAWQQHLFVDEQQTRSHRNRQKGTKNPEQRGPASAATTVTAPGTETVRCMILGATT